MRELAQAPDNRPLPLLDETERSLLAAYIDRFNARDFEALRDMLADEVQLDLVNRLRRKGRLEVGSYFANYSSITGWAAAAGYVDRRPAALIYDTNDPTHTPLYFVLLEWSAARRVMHIRDFRYARYVIESAEVRPGQSGGL